MPLPSSAFLRTRARVPLLIPLSILTCLLLLTACSGTSGTSGTGETSASAPTSTSLPAPTATLPLPTATLPLPTATPAAATGAATIAMGTYSFSGPVSVTIKAGHAVTFTSSGTHELVIGRQGQFAGQNGAPSALNSSNGTLFSPGDSKSIVFPSSGTFNITCTIHPSMQATVVVTP